MINLAKFACWYCVAYCHLFIRSLFSYSWLLSSLMSRSNCTSLSNCRHCHSPELGALAEIFLTPQHPTSRSETEPKAESKVIYSWFSTLPSYNLMIHYYMDEPISVIPLGNIIINIMWISLDPNGWQFPCFRWSISRLYDYEIITPHPRDYGFNEALGH